MQFPFMFSDNLDVQYFIVILIELYKILIIFIDFLIIIDIHNEFIYTIVDKIIFI